MFSELCRETLRKAAVCYSSGRAGSPSPSPPTSPPPSPAKEAKTTANVDLANVRDTCHEARDPGTSGKRSLPQQPSSSTGTCTTEFRDFTGRRSPNASGDSREYVYIRRSETPAFSLLLYDSLVTALLLISAVIVTTDSIEILTSIDVVRCELRAKVGIAIASNRTS